MKPVEVRAPGDLRALRFKSADRELAVLSFSIPTPRFPPGLTPVEREIAAQLFEGLSPAAIARRRRRSRFTVVNEVRSIYAKLGVHSRAELLLRLLDPRNDP